MSCAHPDIFPKKTGHSRYISRFTLLIILSLLLLLTDTWLVIQISANKASQKELATKAAAEKAEYEEAESELQTLAQRAKHNFIPANSVKTLVASLQTIRIAAKNNHLSVSSLDTTLSKEKNREMAKIFPKKIAGYLTTLGPVDLINLTTQNINFVITGSFSATAQFNADLKDSLPALFCSQMTFTEQGELQSRCLGKILMLKTSPAGSTLPESKPVKRLSLPYNPFLAPILHNSSAQPNESPLERYLNYIRARTGITRSDSNKQSTESLLTAIIDNHKGHEVIIGEKHYKVGQKIGQLTIKTIRSHRVILTDAHGTLSLGLSGLNKYESRLE